MKVKAGDHAPVVGTWKRVHRPVTLVESGAVSVALLRSALSLVDASATEKRPIDHGKQ